MRSNFLLAVFISFCLWLLAFNLPPRITKGHIFAVGIDKLTRLSQLPSPKLIFVGGSNLSFGLDCALVEKTLRMPVSNMGLCSTFGLRYNLEQVKDFIHPGDIVILVPEYISLDKWLDGTEDMIREVQIYPPAMIYILRACLTSPSYAAFMVKEMFFYPKTKIRILFSVIDKMCHSSNPDWDMLFPKLTTRYYFDKYGDFFFHLIHPRFNTGYVSFNEKLVPISDEAVNILNDFAHFVRKRRALVCMVPPPLPEKNFFASTAHSDIASTWPVKQIDIPLIARPSRYVFPESDYFEHPYHLNMSGRAKRTQLIIEDLKKYFQCYSIPY